MKFLGWLSSSREQRAHERYMREIEAVERVTVAALEVANAEDLAEQLAAEKIRHADCQRRLQATLTALDNSRGEAERLQAEVDRKSSMPGDHRYWEGRYRDEAAECDRLRAALANAEMDGPKRTLEKANDAQAARAMSRSTKQHFVAYQHAVKMILDRIDELGQKNHVTKEDLRKLRQLWEDLSAQINRTI